MGSAETNSAGRFSVVLDTSMVPRSHLADVGNGPDAFNTLIFGIAPSRQIVLWHEILQLGRATAGDASAIVNLATGAPELAEPNPTHRVRVAGDQIASHYRYVPVLAYNNAPGMHTVFHYTFDASTGMQTMAGTAVATSDGGGFGPFSFNGNSAESTDRSVSRDVPVKGEFHRIIWADYKWVETAMEGCNKFGCVFSHEWDIDHFQGTLAVYNPNKECVKFRRPHHRGRCLRKKTIGRVTYHTPKFTPCSQGHCFTKLTPFFPDFMRSMVNTHSYSWQLDVAGFLGLGAQSAYGSITYVDWNYAKGCNRTRVLWGHNFTPPTAPILQASCRRA
jgi:hypothetical protein